MKSVYAFIAILSFTLLACSKDNTQSKSDILFGKWVEKSERKDTLTIVASGDYHSVFATYSVDKGGNMPLYIPFLIQIGKEDMTTDNLISSCGCDLGVPYYLKIESKNSFVSGNFIKTYSNIQAEKITFVRIK